MNFPFEAHLRLSLALTWRKQCPRCAENSITASSPPPPLHELCRNLVDAESLKVHFHRLCLQSWQRPAFRVCRRGQTTTLTLRSLEVGCLRIIGLQSQSLSTPRKQICPVQIVGSPKFHRLCFMIRDFGDAACWRAPPPRSRCVLSKTISPRPPP